MKVDYYLWYDELYLNMNEYDSSINRYYNCRLGFNDCFKFSLREWPMTWNDDCLKGGVFLVSHDLIMFWCVLCYGWYDRFVW